jgi:LmbE family N-acetylglucosaminyl deacetylase
MSTRRGDADPLVEPTDTQLPAFIRQLHDRDALPPTPPRDRTAKPLVLPQPHPDDCALSVGGTLLKVANPLSLVTVFSDSATAEVSMARQAEDQRCAGLLGAEWSHLGGRERASTSAIRGRAAVAQISGAIRGLAARGAVLLAPAAVARHVDHLAVHQAARSLDAAVFWEDVAFWSIYGASVEDRVQFAMRSSDWLADQVLVAIDVTDAVQAKAVLLGCYRSQSHEAWRPLRYAWAAARELGRPGYCERLFVRSDQIEGLAAALGLHAQPGPDLRYGTVPVRTAWATTTAVR